MCLFKADGEETHVDLIAWLQPARRVPAGLILWIERLILLGGARNFLDACEQAPAAAGGAGAT